MVGCRSPQAFREEADRAAYGIITSTQEAELGAATPFTIERPSETLRRRLLIEQRLPHAAQMTVASPATPLSLSLTNALQAGAFNSRAYQARKEQVFRAALALDLERDAFRNSYAGMLSGDYSADRSGDTSREELEGGSALSVSRRLATGATLAGKLSLDVVKLLTGDRSTSFGLILDTSITIPLMRGAGREIVLEPLTQAERDVAYALYGFERFRKTYAVDVAGAYLAVIQAMEQVANAEASVARLTRSLKRAEKLAEAGRLPELQVDQTRQDVLRARNRLVSERSRVASRLDSLKLALGLPTDAVIEVDDDVRARLAEPPDEDPAEAGVEAAVIEGLTHRVDLLVARRRLEDAARKVRVTANALKAGVTLSASTVNASRQYDGSDTADVSFGDGTYRVGADVDLPWERTSERNAYRSALIALEEARRDVEAQEDAVKQSVREAMRELDEARQACAIQSEAVALAERRVASTALFLEAGRAQVRDVLESEDALLSAQNALTGALIAYRRARWALARDTGLLDVGDAATWE